MLAALQPARHRGRAPPRPAPTISTPAFHAAATRPPCVNLDSWAMPPSLLDALAARPRRHAGFPCYRGRHGPVRRRSPGRRGRTGAAADLAARFRLPVLTGARRDRAIADRRGGGARPCRPRPRRSDRRRRAQPRRQRATSRPRRPMPLRRSGCRCLAHCRAMRRSPCRSAISAWCRPPSTAISRALSTVSPTWPSATSISTHRRGRGADRSARGGPRRAALPPPGQRIALASDAAFTFVYAHVLAGWRRAGAEIVAVLAACRRAAAAILRCLLATGRLPGTRMPAHLPPPAYFVTGCGASPRPARCMANAAATWCWAKPWSMRAGTRHAMTGLLSHVTSFAARKLHLGYRGARLCDDGALGKRGADIRGHEFHYASAGLARRRCALCGD